MGLCRETRYYELNQTISPLPLIPVGYVENSDDCLRVYLLCSELRTSAIPSVDATLMYVFYYPQC